MPTDRMYQQYHRYYNYIRPILMDPVVRSYFSLIASILLIIFLLIFALSPTINIILGLQKKISGQKESITALEVKIGNLVAAQQNYAQVETLVPLLEKALPGRPLPEEIIDRLNHSASESGVAISGLQFKKISLDGFDPGAQTVGFSLSVAGSQEAIRIFWGKIENQLRYLRIKNSSLVINEGLLKAEGHLEGEGFYYAK